MAEWNDRHNRVKQTMSNAIDLFHRLHSDAMEPTANGDAESSRPGGETGMQDRGGGGESEGRGAGQDASRLQRLDLEIEKTPSSRGRNRSSRVGFADYPDAGAGDADEQEKGGGLEVGDEADRGGDAEALGGGDWRNSTMYRNDESSDPSDYTEDDEFEK